MKSRVARIVPLLFASGLTSLIYQVAWMRELRLVFGFSTAASGAVVAIFLGGLGLGSWLLGRRADEVRRPLHFYGRLELGIGGRHSFTHLAGAPALCGNGRKLRSRIRRRHRPAPVAVSTGPRRADRSHGRNAAGREPSGRNEGGSQP